MEFDIIFIRPNIRYAETSRVPDLRWFDSL